MHLSSGAYVKRRVTACVSASRSKTRSVCQDIEVVNDVKSIVSVMMLL